MFKSIIRSALCLRHQPLAAYHNCFANTFAIRSNATHRPKAMETERVPVSVAEPPLKDQLVEHNGKIFTTVREGKAHILVPPHARTSVDPQAKARAGEHIYYRHHIIQFSKQTNEQSYSR